MSDTFAVKSGRDIITTIPYSDGKVTFHFSEISRAHQSFTAMVMVMVRAEKEGVLDDYHQRLDLNSHSAVEGFRRTLQNAYEVKIPWAIVINKAITATVNVHNREQKATHFVNTECEASSFLLYPFLQQDANNMVFGDSEVGKSYYCLRLAAALATGHPFMGYSCDGGKRTLFIDYEDSATVFNKRLFEIAAGMGVDKNTLAESIGFYKPSGSIRDIAAIVSRLVEDGKYDLIVIDAGSNAAGGSPNDEQKVVDMFNALEGIGATKLIIHHEPKDNDNKSTEKAYYGTVFWRALTRVAWRLTLEESGVDKLIKASIAKKSNMGIVEPFYYRQKWEIGEIGANYGPVTFTVEDVQRGQTGEEKVLEALTKHKELTKSQLVELTGLNDNSVKKTCQRLKDRGILDVNIIKKPPSWILAAGTPQ